MRLRWTPQAAGDLEAIFEYLRTNRPHLASQTIARIYSSVQTLKQFPQMGRPLPRKDLRALLIRGLPYICIYRISGEAIQLLHLYHTSQQRPPAQR
jgi:addiction module RelE/StbE family toxin